MKMHNIFINLVNTGLTTGSLRADNHPFLYRKNVLNQVEHVYQTLKLKPQQQHVKLSDGSIATVSMFDIEQMIFSSVMTC